MSENEDDYYMDYYDEEDEKDYISEDEMDFQPDIKAFERVGIGRMVSEIEEMKEQIGLTPLERFTTQVQAVARRLISFEVPLTEEDINIMLDMIPKLDYPEYKNATGYVTGFLASGGGRAPLQKTTVKRTFKNVLPHVLDDSVKKEDVVRYARLWIRL